MRDVMRNLLILLVSHEPLADNNASMCCYQLCLFHRHVNSLVSLEIYSPHLYCQALRVHWPLDTSYVGVTAR